MDITVDNARAGRIAEGAVARIREILPEYADDTVAGDHVATNRAAVHVFAKALGMGSLPSSTEQWELTAAIHRRVHQGIGLLAVLKAIRIAMRAIWADLADDLGSRDTRLFADFVWRYEEWMLEAAEDAYLGEQSTQWKTSDGAIADFLSRLRDGDLADDEAIASSARRLGINLSLTYTFLTADQTSLNSPRDLHPLLSRLVETISRAFPLSYCAVNRTSLVSLVATPSPAGLRSQLLPVLPGDSGASPLRIGIGRPASSARGIMDSAREGIRALALGEIAAPQKLLHAYDDLATMDVFSDERAVNAFIEAMLRPLLDLDEERSRRLLHTLYVYYSYSMRRKLTASSLCIHPNTLDYRLSNVADVLGFDPSSGAAPFRFLLAVKLLPLSQHRRLLADSCAVKA